LKRFATLLVLLLASASTLAQEVPEDEQGLLMAMRSTHDPVRALLLCEAFLDRFPESSEVGSVLRMLLERSTRTLETRQKALGFLLRVERERPALRRVLGRQHRRWLVEKLAGWKFTSFPLHVRPQRNYPVPSWYDAGPAERGFRVFFVPGEAERRSLLAIDLERPGLALPPREAWVAVSEFCYRAAGPDRNRVEFSKPGTWIIEEEVDGLTNISVVAARTWWILVRGCGRDAVVWAFDPIRRSAVEGVSITVRQKDDVTEGKTGGDGTFRFRRTSDAVVIAQRGEEVQGAVLWKDEDEETASKPIVYVTTDRPVYRPGHEVRYRALRRDRAEGSLMLPMSAPVRVDLRDPQGRLIAHRMETWDADGVISGAFTLAEEPPLGTWTVVVKVRDYRYGEHPSEWNLPESVTDFWRRPFRVEEYRKPEIRVSFEPAGSDERGHPRGRIRVRYATGEPVAGAAVEWWSQARYPAEESSPLERHPHGWFFDRPSCDGWDRDDLDSWGMATGGSGEGKTGEDGTLLVGLYPEADELDPDLEDATVFNVHAMVTGTSRLGVEANGTIPVAGSGDRVSIEIPVTWIAPGEALSGRVVVRDATGAPAAERRVELFCLESIGSEEEHEFEESARAAVVTGPDGSATFSFAVPKTGKVRVRARCRTASASARHDVVVASSRSLELPWHRGDDVAPLDLLPDRVVYEPGDTARILVRYRGTPRAARALVIVETEGLRSVGTESLIESVPVIEIPITADLVPTVLVTVITIGLERIHVSSHELLVFPRKRMLSVAATPERAEYAPGDRVRIRVETRDAAGRAVPAVVELAVVDESIFDVAKDLTEDLRSFFFPFQVSDGETELPPLKRARLHRAWRVRWFSFDEEQPQFGTADEGAAAGGDSPGVRRRFADTMHYDARVRTGEDGTATVEIDAPDDLARWRIVARAVAGPDRFGVATSSTVTRKDVTVRIAAPRFFTVRDEGVIGTVVRNDLADDAEFTVHLAAEGLEVQGEPRTVRIPAGGEILLDWTYRATTEGTARVRAKAVSAKMSDLMEITIPVLPHGALQRVSAAGRVDGTWRASLTLPPGADRASARLVVRASSLASSLGEALPFLAGYPYGCVEQTMSRFLPSVVAARALRRLDMQDPALDAELPKMVEQGLLKLYRYQHEDGGWGWWEHDETHPFMTAYVVFGLQTARDAGVAVDAETITRGVAALLELETSSPTAFGRYVLARGEADLSDAPKFEPRTTEDRAWLTLAGTKGLLSDYRPPASRDTGAAIREVALALRAVRAENPADPRIAELATWLLSHRRGAAWHSTLDSAYAVLALAEIAKPAGTISAQVRVNGSDVGTTSGALAIAAAELITGENVVELTVQGNAMVFASAALGFRDTTAENLAPIEGAFSVDRVFERAVLDEDGDRDWEPIESGATVKPGEELRVVITVKAHGDREFVMIECPLPAGAEAWPDEEYLEWWYDAWYQRRELRDDRVAVAAREISGTESFTFRLRTTQPGSYHVMPARAFSMYEPHESGRSAEFILRVRKK
jgi:alpha-2-macroglobulin